MGGDDKSNQRIGTYHVLMKSMKWWKMLFFHFLNITIFNSFPLFQDWRSSHPEAGNPQRWNTYSHLNFRENLCQQLASINIDDDIPLYHPAVHSSKPLLSFHTLHVPELTSSTKNCWLCYHRDNSRKERKTQYAGMALECKGKPLCLVKNRNCF